MSCMLPATEYKYLERDPKSSYRQLSIKGRRIRARTLYGLYMSAEEPRTVEQIAADYHLPIEAVQEAVAYCQSKPPEIEEDWRRQEAMIRAAGLADPSSRFNSYPRPISPQQRAAIRRGQYE